MMESVNDFDFREIKRRYPFQAGYIDTKLGWVRPALMMSIDAADAAEIVLRCASIELIEGEKLFAFAKLDVIQLS